MKKALTFLAILLAGIAAKAQSPAPETIATYSYCEIIAPHLPVHNGSSVAIDFGQEIRAMSYNWLRDAEGKKRLFNSGVEALNYLVSQGWEFVQAYTSGEHNEKTHFLLRIPTARFENAQQQLTTPPRGETAEKQK